MPYVCLSVFPHGQGSGRNRGAMNLLFTVFAVFTGLVVYA